MWRGELDRRLGLLKATGCPLLFRQKRVVEEQRIEGSLELVFDKDGIQLWAGDCREVLPRLEPVDHVITDPPYEAESHTKGKRRGWGQRSGCKPVTEIKRQKGAEAVRKFVDAPLNFDAMDEELRTLCGIEFARLTKRWALVFCQIEAAMIWRDAMVYPETPEGMVKGLRYVRTGIWEKTSPMPQLSGDRPGTGFEAITICHHEDHSRWNGGGGSNVWRHGSVSVNEAHHPTPKPISLMAELVADFTDPGETILDCFAGSGTTLVAAYRSGRKAIGVERDPKYVALIIERLEAELKQGRLFVPAKAEQVPLFAETKRASTASIATAKPPGLPSSSSAPAAP